MPPGISSKWGAGEDGSRFFCHLSSKQSFSEDSQPICPPGAGRDLAPPCPSPGVDTSSGASPCQLYPTDEDPSCGSRWGGCAEARARLPMLSGGVREPCGGNGCRGYWRQIRRQGGGGQAFFCLHDGSPAASAGSTGQKKACISGRSPIFSGGLAGFAGGSWPENVIRRAEPANNVNDAFGAKRRRGSGGLAHRR